jgi:hypothetical protein
MKKEFKVNKFLTLTLEGGETYIFVCGKQFLLCRSILIGIPKPNMESFENVESIDELSERIESYQDKTNISPETEFWGHCSNLQAWYENNYDSRILHRDIAFPLLKQLTEVGDLTAKKVFKEEIAKRLSSGFPSVVDYLIEENYIDYLSREEFIYSLLIDEEAEIVEKLEKSYNVTFSISSYIENLEVIGMNLIVVHKKHIIELKLHEIRMIQFPQCITQLKFLKRLALSKVGLKSISINIGSLIMLQYLDLSNNEINGLPESLSKLQDLNELYLENNQLTLLPQTIGKLSNLKDLNLNNNLLTSLPETFSNLDSLDWLQLLDNNFGKIPEIIGELKSLSSLFLTRNKFLNIPNCIQDKKDLSVSLF